MNELPMVALGVVSKLFACYETLPVGLTESHFIDYTLQQFQKRLARLEQARGASQVEIDEIAHQVIERNDA